MEGVVVTMDFIVNPDFGVIQPADFPYPVSIPIQFDTNPAWIVFHDSLFSSVPDERQAKDLRGVPSAPGSGAAQELAGQGMGGMALFEYALTIDPDLLDPL